MSELTDDQKDLIEEVTFSYGFPIKAFEEDPDGDYVANLGRFIALQDDEDQGLFEDDEGILYAQIVGAKKYNNEHVAFYFLADGFEGTVKIDNPALQVEPI